MQVQVLYQSLDDDEGNQKLKAVGSYYIGSNTLFLIEKYIDPAR